MVLLKKLKWGFLFNTDNVLLDTLKKLYEKGNLAEEKGYSIGQGLNLTKDYFVLNDNKWTTRRCIKEGVPVIIVPKEQKLGKYLNDFLIVYHYNKILITPISKDEYKKEYLEKYHGFNRAFESLDEEFVVECAYDHLMSRCTSIDFDKDTDFIKLKEDGVTAYVKVATDLMTNQKIGYCYFETEADRSALFFTGGKECHL